MRRLLPALGVLLSLAGPAFADFAAGEKAFKVGDYDAALAAWRPLAETGDAEAQYRLGQMYARGLGADLDQEQAVRWLQAAAEQGHPLAQGRLAAALAQGKGAARDLVEAYKWLTLAAARQGGTFRPARDDVARQMTAEQIAEAERRAAAWRPRN